MSKRIKAAPPCPCGRFLITIRAWDHGKRTCTACRQEAYARALLDSVGQSEQH